MSKQEVILSENRELSLKQAISNCPHDKLFILADECTAHLCIPHICEVECLKGAEYITIGATDTWNRTCSRRQRDRAEESFACIDRT